MGKKEIGKLDKSWSKTSNPRIKRRYDGSLYARFSKLGGRIEQKLHETTMAAAEKALLMIDDVIREGVDAKKPIRQIREEIKQKFSISVKKMPTEAVLIGELHPKFVAYRKAGDPKKEMLPWRASTLLYHESYYKRCIKPFWEYRTPNEIEDQWEEAIKFERARSKLGEDIGFTHYISCMDAFTTWLVDNNYLQKKPMLFDPNWAKASTEEDDDDLESKFVFSDDQIEDALTLAMGAFGCYVHCGFFMGMRSSEISQMKKSRIKIDKGLIILKASDVKTGSKTGHGRIIPIHPRALKAIKEQILRSGDSEYLFPNYRDSSRPMDKTGFKRSWWELMESLGTPDGIPHSMRHTFATKGFADPKINPVLLCKMLGMSMAVAEKHYIHFRPEQLATVVNQFNYGKSGKPGTILGL
jgi:hypothetical protein